MVIILAMYLYTAGYLSQVMSQDDQQEDKRNIQDIDKQNEPVTREYGEYSNNPLCTTLYERKCGQDENKSSVIEQCLIWKGSYRWFEYSTCDKDSLCVPDIWECIPKKNLDPKYVKNYFNTM